MLGRLTVWCRRSMTIVEARAKLLHSGDITCPGAKHIAEILALGRPLVVLDDFPTPAKGHGLQGDETIGLDLGCVGGDAKVLLPFVAHGIIVGLFLATGR